MWKHVCRVQKRELRILPLFLCIMYIIDFVVLKVKVIQGTSYSFFCKKKWTCSEFVFFVTCNQFFGETRQLFNMCKKIVPLALVHNFGKPNWPEKQKKTFGIVGFSRVWLVLDFHVFAIEWCVLLHDIARPAGTYEIARNNFAVLLITENAKPNLLYKRQNAELGATRNFFHVYNHTCSGNAWKIENFTCNKQKHRRSGLTSTNC
jgi:hypothetical protein